MKKRIKFTVSDGKLVLSLEPAEEGGYIITSPFEPELITPGRASPATQLAIETRRRRELLRQRRNFGALKFIEYLALRSSSSASAEIST